MAAPLVAELGITFGLLLAAAGFALGVVAMSHAVTGFAPARHPASLSPTVLRVVACVVLATGFALVMVTTGVLHAVVQQSILR